MFLIGKSWWMTQPENMAASALKDKGPSTYSTKGYQMLIGSFVGTKTNGLTDHKGHVCWVIRNSFLDWCRCSASSWKDHVSFHTNCIQLHGGTELYGWLNQRNNQWEHRLSIEGLDEAGCPAFGTMALSHVSSLEVCIDGCSCMFVGHHVIAPKFG